MFSIFQGRSLRLMFLAFPQSFVLVRPVILVVIFLVGTMGKEYLTKVYCRDTSLRIITILAL